MSSQPGLAVAPTNTLALDVRRFPWIKRLASDYAHDFGRVADFFAGNPADTAAWSAAIERTRRQPRPGAAVADLVAAQQDRRQAPPPAREAAQRLRDPQTVAIVTGQQAGVFGGPLFTLLKAVTALQLAERVRREQQVPVVTIFWVDAEDHDWDEVRACGVLDEQLNLRSIDAGAAPPDHQGPIAGVRLDDSINQTIEALAAALPTTEFTADLLDVIRRAYCTGTGMADAFGRWLEAVLGPHGLIVFDASDPAAKPLVTDLFAGEIAHPGRTSRLAAEAGAALTMRGYHAQVTPAEGGVALFHLEGARQPIRYADQAFTIGNRTVSASDLATQVRTTPEAFSPNVLLRPLVQDTLFPTLCYVAGPNELAYLGQLRGVYEAFGVPMPLLYQRASVTIVDANAMRFLSRQTLPLESLRAQDEAALNALLEAQLPPSVDAAITAALDAVDRQMIIVGREVQQVDATLEKAAQSAAGRMRDDLHKLHGKIIQASKKKDDTLRRQFQHARAQAFPGGHPQEREIGFVYFLNKYGPTLPDHLIETLPVEMGTHWVITL